jgi:hypothetical protein
MDMTRVGGFQWLTSGAAIEHILEANISGLIARGVGVDQVISNNLCPRGAKAQCVCVYAEGFVEANSHWGDPLLLNPYRTNSKPCANSVCCYLSVT